MRFTLFFLTVLGIAFLVGFALLSARVRAFWQRIPLGLHDPARPRPLPARDGQPGSWPAGSPRFASYWALLDAFHIGGSVRNALLVLAVQVVASVFPFTPGGAGVQQALLLTIFARSSDVAAFSVGQQIATAMLTSALGFAALVLIFRFRSFREVIARGREHRRRERAEASAGAAVLVIAAARRCRPSAATTAWSRTARSAPASSTWRCDRS